MWRVKGFEPRTTRWKAWRLSLEQQKNVFASWMFLSSWQKQIFNWMQKSSCHSAVILCTFLRFIRFDLSSPKFLSTKVQKTRQQQKTYQNLKKSLSRPWSRGEDDFSAFLKGGFHDEIGTRTPPRFVYLSTPKKGDRVSEKNVPVRSVTNFFLVPEKSRTLGLPRESVLFFWQVLWRCQLNPRFPFLLLLLLRQRNVSCGDRIIFWGLRSD